MNEIARAFQLEQGEAIIESFLEQRDERDYWASQVNQAPPPLPAVPLTISPQDKVFLVTLAACFGAFLG
jgi:hypothetical protein